MHQKLILLPGNALFSPHSLGHNWHGDIALDRGEFFAELGPRDGT